MTSETAPQESPSAGERFWHGLGTLFKFILRLAFVVVLAVLLGSAVYFGVTYGLPALQRQYIQPVQDNSLRLDSLESQYERDIQQINSRLDALTDRLETLETQSDDTKQDFADLQAQLDSMADTQETQAAVLEDIFPLQSEISENRDAIDELQSELSALQTESETLSDTVSEHDQDLQELNEENADQVAQLAELQRDFQLLWTLDLITRSRLDIAQDNFGLARSAAQAARDRLAALEEDTQFEGSEVIPQIMAYLDTAVENLTDNPQAAEEALLNAWRAIVLNMPVEQP
jgi:DNA repair exonuclease SbcCD ATPase subunit